MILTHIILMNFLKGASPVGAVAGRIMSSLAGSGGLAHKGGLASIGGGLAA